MTDAVHCPDCGQPLPSDAPQGECPRCLLRVALESQPPADSALAMTRTSSGSWHFVPPTVAELQQRIPQYEILELIGQGGMGAVYKARQRGLERFVAIKILPFENNQSTAFAERFAREARALALLSHPHIVTVHDFGQADGMCYFVMEYVAGVNLRQALQAGKMNPAEALAIVPQICEALQYAHDEGVVHRDIKPENILIDARGRVKIADFGLAKLLGVHNTERSLTGTQQVMGTLRYMAPEQMLGTKEVDHRADIFSLGVVFYELLTGELPIGRFAPPSKKAAVDARLDEVVLRALENEPAERYQHVSEMKTGVEAVARSPQPVTMKPSVAKTPSADAPPRLSAAALWGVILAPLFLVTLLMISGSAIVYREEPGQAGPPLALRLIAMLLIIPGVVGIFSPFATTLLGWLAISNIRRSQGKLYGLPLALFDALLFPLLLLDALLIWLGLVVFLLGFSLLGQGPLNPQLMTISLLLTGLLILPLVLVLDVWLVRLAWQAANRDLTTSDLPLGKEPPPFQPAQSRQTSTTVVLLVIGAILLIPLVLVCALAGAWFLAPINPTSPPKSPKSAPSRSDEPSTISVEPIVRVELARAMLQPTHSV